MTNYSFLKIKKDFNLAELIGKNVTFVNPFSYLELANPNNGVKLKEFTIFADGIGVVYPYNIFLKAEIGRFSFDNTSIAPSVFEFAQKNGLGISLVGGKPGIASKSAELFINKYPSLKIENSFSGYFNSDNPKIKVLEKLAKSDIVIVGMGVPLQEKFLLELRQMNWTGTGFTCGGFLEQTTEKGMIYYPTWADKSNLRWFYRLLDEPNRLSRRYLIIYPRFFLLFIYQFVRSRLFGMKFGNNEKSETNNEKNTTP